MKFIGAQTTACLLILLAIATPAHAHRLDEYLQATTISLDKNHIDIRMRLTPGVAVFDRVFKSIDTNGDGTLSDAERRAYADLVRSEISFTLNGKRLPLRLISLSFPTMDDMKHGLGDILLDFQADAPAGRASHALDVENHHQRGISVCLVNCLVPKDQNIRVTRQDRNNDQSIYQLTYTAGTADSREPNQSDETGNRSLMKAFFFQGVHHILTGYDHLLFVSALVLAATTLWDLIKVVSTFTLAHTITLTLAALNLVHLPARVVEPLISASIVFVAAQNVFRPGRARGWSRLWAAFFFGLFHGMGFAGGLLEAMQEMQSSSMLLGILAFSIGVEAGHQMVVLPLFALLKGARATQTDAVRRARVAMGVQRIGSAGISLAGIYFLFLAFRS